MTITWPTHDMSDAETRDNHGGAVVAKFERRGRRELDPRHAPLAGQGSYPICQERSLLEASRAATL